MSTYESNNIKNIALLGHAGSGKTTLAESMLFESGKIQRQGNVEDKNTVSDYHDIEHERGNSIFSTLMHTDWRGTKVNIIDTPGFDDFIGNVISSLKVVDTGILLLNVQHGIEVGTEQVWEHATKLKTPIILAANHLDHEKSDFDTTLEQTKDRFGRKVTVVQYPLNQGVGFDTIIDVLKMTMYKFPAGGGKPEKQPIPEAEAEKAENLHNDLVETIAENDEALMELFFEKGTLEEEELIKGFKTALANREVFPLFCLAAKLNMGSGRLMGFIGNAVPSTIDLPPQELEDGETLACDPKGATSLFVYKTISEPHLGDMSFFKVCSGEVKTGIELINEQTGESERINQLFEMEGKSRNAVTSLMAGDIGATVKLKKTHSNNTLHMKGQKVAFKSIVFPEPTIRTAIIALKKGEEEKLSSALQHIVEEDPTVIIELSPELGQMILHGQGELHLAIVKWRLENMYNLSIDFIEPKIPYRETIHKSANSHYKHKKQSGGAGQFAEIYMLVEPYSEGMPDPPNITIRKRDTVELKWGGTLEFCNCIVGGAIDNRFMGAIQKGIMEKMHDGPLTGCYARDIRVCVHDGKMHSVDSNDMAFKTAAMMAFKAAFFDADPKILEPIYDIEVTVPDEMMGDVMSDLQTRRSVILGMEALGSNQLLKAKVPLAELYKYSSALRSLSQGRAKYTRTFSEYQLVPANIQQQVINANKEEVEEV